MQMHTWHGEREREKRSKTKLLKKEKKKKFWHNINKVVASRKVSSFLPSLARLFEDLANTPMEKEGPSGSPGIGNAEEKKKWTWTWTWESETHSCNQPNSTTIFSHVEKSHVRHRSHEQEGKVTSHDNIPKKMIYDVPSPSFAGGFAGWRSAAGWDLVSMGDVGFDGGEVAKLSRSSKLARALFSFKLDQKRIIIKGMKEW